VPSSHIVRAYAAIEREGSILVIKFDDAGLVHNNLPGGGVLPGETVQEGLAREVKEEASCDVVVGALLFAHEYQPGAGRDVGGGAPAIRLVFRCELAEGSEPSMPNTPDPKQVGVSWAPLDEIGHGVQIRPQKWSENIARALRRPGQQPYFAFGL
jgi:8-oxo-dGTP pyrophosphatase MutT (NUDIX family)